MPSSPLNAAGMRMDPPPSPPLAMGSRPPATAAADPPEDPPAVRPCCQGLWVVPLSLVVETLRPPNSDAVVWPTGLAPPRSKRRESMVLVYVALRSLNTSEASVWGQPSTTSSSLMPTGTPPNGSEVSADAARSRAASASM
jgi:hypothetical protein